MKLNEFWNDSEMYIYIYIYYKFTVFIYGFPGLIDHPKHTFIHVFIPYTAQLFLSHIVHTGGN